MDLFSAVECLSKENPPHRDPETMQDHPEQRPPSASFKTPAWLIAIGLAAVGLPIIMMVENTDTKIQDLTQEGESLRFESESLRNENDMLGEVVAVERLRNQEMKIALSAVTNQRDQLVVKLENSETRESSLFKVVENLKEEVQAAKEEAKLMAAAWQRDAGQMKELVSNSEETAYALLQENRGLKASIQAKDASMMEMLGEVSGLNTELAYLKDERDEMNREILRITAQVRTLRAGIEGDLIQAADVR
jgi:chromosome segregation ATPase